MLSAPNINWLFLRDYIFDPLIDELRSIGWIKSLYNKVSKGIDGTEFREKQQQERDPKFH
jgi:hypothetical protein